MEETQSFRLIGTTDTVEITVNHVGGQNIVYWEDIEQVFPGVKHTQNGKVAVNMLRDSDGTRIMPHRIKHFPDVVLDVVLSTTVEHVHAESTMATPSQAPTRSPIDGRTDHHRPSAVNDMFHISPPSSLPAKGSEKNSFVTAAESVSDLAIAMKPSSDLSLSEPLHFGLIRTSTMQIREDMKVATDVMIARNRAGKPLDGHSILKQCLPAGYCKSMPTTVTAKSGFERAVIHKLDGLQHIAEEIFEIQKQMNDRLILIQSKTEAILTQNYELLEYTIPRLFIVLPETSTPWDPATMFRTKFRLHFICECGEHTKATGSSIPHHLHLAKHEGYAINKPTEFFEKYGPFLMLMLSMIKLGTSIAGHVVPALSSLRVVDVLDAPGSTLNSVTTKVIKGIDYSLAYLEESRTLTKKSDDDDVDGDVRPSQQDLASYLAGVEGLEGVDLCQLGLYLAASSTDNLLGNLYRMTTNDGHVKWVCRDHYRAGYQEAHTQKLRNVVKLARGTFDEQLGRIEITLKSSFAAAEFYDAIHKAKGVLELIVDLNWECARSDLEVLEDTLKKSTVSVLRLGLQKFRTSLGSKLLLTSARYKVLSRIIELPNMKKIHIVLPKDFVMLSSFHPIRPSHLRKLTFELAGGEFIGKELGLLADALKTNSTLTTLDLRNNSIGDNGAQALSEALKINSTLTTLDLSANSIGDNGAVALSEAFKTNSTLITLDLSANSIGDNGAQMLSEALKTNLTLTTLNLRNNSIGPNGAQALSETLKSNSTLTALELQYNSIGDNGAQVLAEALKTNSTLTTWDLSANSIGDNGAQALFEALKTNSTLTTLNLRNNSIGSKGAQALSEALKVNSTLAALDLRNNSIEDNGAQALSEAIKASSTLTNLALHFNSIGPNGALALSEARKTTRCNIIY
ncbi:hypothetical protein BGZ50_009716 [Haplosporangium sp. Z 11]|nr:hypothetical protein BGZ50_009716 [Haplosporangium sp. Z 11]